ncbi:MAG: hypothetical protein AAF500_09825 [Myxococcota bacterium]
MASAWVGQLVEAGLVTEAQVRDSGARDAEKAPVEAMRGLLSQGLDERALAGFFVSLGFGPVLRARELARADTELVQRLSGKDAHDLCAVPLRPSPAGAVVAMADPTDAEAIDRLAEALGGPILPTVARLSDLLDALDQLYPGDRPTVVSDPMSAARSKHPSGVVPLIQDKAARAPQTPDGTLPSLDPKLAGLAHTASSVWDRAWDRNTGVESAPPPADEQDTQDARDEPIANARPASTAPESPSLSELGHVTTRDEVVRVACEACLTHASGAAFLALRKGVFRGWDGAGAHVTSASIRSLWVPASNPSVLSDVAHRGKSFRGPHGQTAADHLLRAAIGSQGRDIFVTPVRIGERTCGLLCATDPVADPRGIEEVASAMGRAFQRLIVSHKSEGSILP